MKTLSIKLQVLMLVFFILFGLSLQSPIASNDYVPQSIDFIDHTTAIIQAKLALEQGQFPLHTAPSIHDYKGYALFTYYSPLPYLIAGTLYKYFPANPFFIFKLTLLFFMVLAGIYIFKLTYWLCHQPSASFLASIAYMSSPYFLLNMNVRGDFTETIAQGLLPIVLYYTFRLYDEPKLWRIFLFAVLAWTALIHTHLITFIYSSLFIGLFLFFISFTRKGSIKQLAYCGMAYAVACLLSVWYFAPIAMTAKYLYATDVIFSPFENSWLTPLSTLLSVRAVSPMPLPGNHHLTIPLYCSIGWPILLAFAILLFLTVERTLKVTLATAQFIKILLALFVIATFIMWSPIDFWQWMPHFSFVLQYTYRLLTQTMWIGALLLCIACIELFGTKMNIRQTTIAALLIIMCNGGWLTTNSSNEISVSQIQSSANILSNQANHAYLVDYTRLPHVFFAQGNDLPLMNEDRSLALDEPLLLPTSLLTDASNIVIHMAGTLLTTSHQPVELLVNIDNQPKKSFILQPGHIELSVPLKSLVSMSQKNFTIAFQLSGSNTAKIQLDSIQLTHMPATLTTPALDTIKHNCFYKNAQLNCRIQTATDALVALPYYYYPDLIRTTVNGIESPSVPVLYKDGVLTGLSLPPGSYEITVDNVGIAWANWISTIMWGMVLVMSLLVFAQTYRPLSYRSDSSVE